MSVVRVGFAAGFAIDWTWDAAAKRGTRTQFGEAADTTAPACRSRRRTSSCMFVNYAGGSAGARAEGPS